LYYKKYIFRQGVLDLSKFCAGLIVSGFSVSGGFHEGYFVEAKARDEREAE